MTVYVPFWILIEFLDSTKYDPFIKCHVLKDYETESADGSEVKVYDLQIKTDLIAPAIPQSYTIQPEDLQLWADRIADWIRKFPEELDAD